MGGCSYTLHFPCTLYGGEEESTHKGPSAREPTLGAGGDSPASREQARSPVPGPGSAPPGRPAAVPQVTGAQARAEPPLPLSPHPWTVTWGSFQPVLTDFLGAHLHSKRWKKKPSVPHSLLRFSSPLLPTRPPRSPSHPADRPRTPRKPTPAPPRGQHSGSTSHPSPPPRGAPHALRRGAVLSRKPSPPTAACPAASHRPAAAAGEQNSDGELTGFLSSSLTFPCRCEPRLRRPALPAARGAGLRGAEAAGESSAAPRIASSRSPSRLGRSLKPAQVGQRRQPPPVTSAGEDLIGRRKYWATGLLFSESTGFTRYRNALSCSHRLAQKRPQLFPGHNFGRAGPALWGSPLPRRAETPGLTRAPQQPARRPSAAPLAGHLAGQCRGETRAFGQTPATPRSRPHLLVTAPGAAGPLLPPWDYVTAGGGDPRAPWTRARWLAGSPTADEVGEWGGRWFGVSGGPFRAATCGHGRGCGAGARESVRHGPPPRPEPGAQEGPDWREGAAPVVHAGGGKCLHDAGVGAQNRDAHIDDYYFKASVLIRYLMLSRSKKWRPPVVSMGLAS